MTLCSQWQKEIEKFAPWMKVITIHSGENHNAQDMASADIVVCSTYVITNVSNSSDLLKLLRCIHFHRMILDESHYNQTGQRAKLSLASLSSTFRYCVTGTPVGHSLADLYGQLRFLRVPLFFVKTSGVTTLEHRTMVEIQMPSAFFARFCLELLFVTQRSSV
jgi:SNF2 family DNA or RNA helicase